MGRMTFSFLVVALLMGCASPSRDMLGALRRDVTVDGMRFAVFHAGAEVQVIRLSYASRAERARVPGRMLRAIGQATGCTVIPDSLTLEGGPGSAVARADLRCPDPPQPG
ncbi:hypothetical protein [Paracoccus sp. T5]|uniref:hypothetical protein n=1 Tax=Paracoccus sp. T5 TaxID=3402161 RepID=UPI003AE8B0FA